MTTRNARAIAPRGGLSVRPIRETDAAAFAALHGRADADAVSRLIAESRRAFDADGPGPLRQVLVLVEHAADTVAARRREPLLGAIALTGSSGLDLPRYVFRRGVVVHASAELKLFHRAGTLLLCNDLTGCAELGLPWVSSAAGAAHAAEHQRLLIDAALLFVADRPDRCAGTLVATLPGIRHGSGGSPFWSGLGRHFHTGAVPDDDPFFAVPARSHIGRLFPKHPLYASFLGPDAQACLGQRALPARAVDDALRAQGLRSHGHVDIVDGGPVLMAEVADLAALRGSRRATLRIDDDITDDSGGDSGERGDFRTVCLLAPGTGGDDDAASWVPARIDTGDITVSVPLATARALGAEAGQTVRVFVTPRR